MATVALMAWPALALIFFARLRAARGLIWSVLVGYLFLPEAFALDLPSLPPLDKRAAIALASILGTLMFPDPKPQVRPARTAFPVLMYGLFALLIGASIATTVTNGSALVNGDVVRPGMRFVDLRTMTAASITTFTPLFLAYLHLTKPEHHREFLVALVTLGLLYSLMALIELRLSPKFHIWTYGYFQHQWLQHVRGGGFRPALFLKHGLWVGFFLFTVAMAAMILSQTNHKNAKLYFWVAGWMLVILVLSRNLGATALGLIFAPLVLMLSVKMKVRLAAFLALFFLSYPMLLSIGASPAHRVLDWVEPYAPERAASLAFRLSNEERLIERALERPAFGWGIWGRGRVLDERGVDLSVTDGIWIVTLGERGWLGFLGFFGTLIIPLLALLMRNRLQPPSPEIAGIALIMGINFLYLIPNSTLSPIGLMLVGTIAASMRFKPMAAPLAVSESSEADSPADEGTRTRYSRFGATHPTRSSPARARAAQTSSRAQPPSRYTRT